MKSRGEDDRANSAVLFLQHLKVIPVSSQHYFIAVFASRFEKYA